jgi:hypothetical protein
MATTGDDLDFDVSHTDAIEYAVVGSKYSKLSQVYLCHQGVK